MILLQINYKLTSLRTGSWWHAVTLFHNTSVIITSACCFSQLWILIFTCSWRPIKFSYLRLVCKSTHYKFKAISASIMINFYTVKTLILISLKRSSQKKQIFSTSAQGTLCRNDNEFGNFEMINQSWISTRVFVTKITNQHNYPHHLCEIPKRCYILSWYVYPYMEKHQSSNKQMLATSITCGNNLNSSLKNLQVTNRPQQINKGYIDIWTAETILDIANWEAVKH